MTRCGLCGREAVAWRGCGDRRHVEVADSTEGGRTIYFPDPMPSSEDTVPTRDDDRRSSCAKLASFSTVRRKFEISYTRDSEKRSFPRHDSSRRGP